MICFFVLFPWLNTFAYDCEINGIYYNRLSADELEVTCGSVKYTGNIIVPETVEYRDKTFKVTQINADAFKSCTALATVSLPEGITSLPYSAFEGCSSLSSISIPQSVNSIGARAFYNCKSLTSAEIPISVTKIGNNMFYGCSKLATVSIPQGVTTIEENAFWGCSSLTTLQLPEELTLIGGSAFRNCSALTTIILPNGLTSLGQYLFSGCRNLSSVTLPDELSWIPTYAFQNCTNLVSVNLPDKLTTIYDGAFYGCTNLSVVSMPKSVYYIGENAYQGCTGLKKVIVNDMQQWCYITFKSASSNPLYYAKHLYSDEETEIKVLMLDANILSIKNYAFYNADNLSSICVLANEPPTINPSTFGNTIYTWTDLYVKEGLKEAYQNANYWSNFKYISEFSSINANGITYSIVSSTEMAVVPRTDGEKYSGDIAIPDSISYLNRKFAVASIGENAFLDCTTLTSISLPQSLKHIYSNALKNCSSLKHVSIPEGVGSIATGTFQGCTSLTSVTIPESVTSIGYGAFEGCTSLVSVDIPESVVYIASNAFQNCSGLTSINIPSSVKRIDWYAFSGCSNIKSVYITDLAAWCNIDFYNEPLRLENYRLYLNGEEIKELVIPENATSSGLFSGCVSIKSVVIPEGVTTIVAHAFQECSNLASVTIPQSVTKISQSAFSLCYNLSLIASKNSTPPTIDNYWVDATLLVPNGCKDTYLNTKGWNQFSDIVEVDFYKGEFVVLKSTAGGKIIYDGQEVSGESKAFAVSKGSAIPLKIELDNDYEFTACVLDGDSTKDISKESERVFSYTLNADKGHLVDIQFVKLLTEGSSYNQNGIYYKVLPGNKMEVTLKKGPGGAGPSSIGYSGNVIIPDSVIIPASFSHPEREYKVTSISNLAFRNDNDGFYREPLYSVVIGNNVTSIPDSTFYICKNLTSVTIGNNVTSIGRYAFYNCPNLTSIRIPSGVQSLPSDAFSYCRKLESVIIPESITEIGAYAFIGCDSLKSIVFPNSLKSIGYGAFQGCEKLGSLTIPASVIKIGQQAFYGCSGLYSIIVESDNPNYDSRDNCNALIETNTNKLLQGCNSSFIPVGVTSINRDAFYRCSSLTSIIIPNSVKNIGDQAFRYCSNLTNLTLPHNVTTIGRYAFSGCSKLTEIIIPKNVTSIGKSAFTKCSSLTSIIILDGNSIYDSRNNCNAIIETATNTLLFGCQNTIIPKDVNAIADNAFVECTGLTAIIIPEIVSLIGDYAFYGCSSLTNIIIPNAITTINRNTFQDCNALSFISIGNNVNKIDFGAFYGCDDIKSFTSHTPTPPMIEFGNNFDYPTFSSYSATLYVPYGSKEAYQNAEGWKNFSNIVELDQTSIQNITLNKDANMSVYDLNGKRLEEPNKGINIIGGKKVVLK